MHTTTSSSPSDPRGLSALWLGITGASLLVAAATVFVAVRWDQLSLGPRSAILAVITGAFLVIGQRLRHVVPTTGSILLHVGALLVAIDTTALTVALGASLGAGLLVGGITSVVVHGYLGNRLDSRTLRWAARIGAMFASGGVSLLTGLPAGVVLGLIALTAVAVGRDEDALVLGIVTGLAPLGVAIERLVAPAVTPFAELGYPTTLPAAGFATGAIAAIALGILAHDRHDQRLALASLVAVGVGAVDGLAAPEATMAFAFAAFASALVLVELRSLSLQPGSIWFSPVRAVRFLLEGITAWLTVVYSLIAFGEADFAPAFAIAAVGFLLAEQVRGGAGLATLRNGSEWWLTTLVSVASIGAIAATASADTRPAAVAIGAIVLAAGLIASQRSTRDMAAASLVLVSLSTSISDELTLAVALAGAAIMLFAADHAHRVRREAVALLSIVPLLNATAAFDRLVEPDAWILVARDPGWAFAVIALGAASIFAEYAPRSLFTTMVATRLLAILFATVAVFDGASWMVALPGALLVTYAIGRAIQTRWTTDIAVAALAAQAGAAATAHLVGASMPYVGTTLLVVTAMLAAIAAVLPTGQRLAMLPTIGALLLAPDLMLNSPEAWADAFLIIGLGGAAFATTVRSEPLRIVMLAVAAIGTWVRLGVGGIDVLEAYVAPLALLLLVGGVSSLRRGESSWIALGPAMGLLGGPATFLLFAGADYETTHLAVLVGLGMVGVLVGAQANLAAPLFVGTAALGTAMVHGVLAVEITMPTWVWLASSGALLIGAAMSFERRSTTPVEAGRQLVANIQHRFR